MSLFLKSFPHLKRTANLKYIPLIISTLDLRECMDTPSKPIPVKVHRHPIFEVLHFLTYLTEIF